MIEEARNNYIEATGAVFELRAYNEDGDTLVSYTGTSFDDVSGYSQLADDFIDHLVVESEESRVDANNAIAEDELQQDKSY